MSVLADHQIRSLVARYQMIEPFEPSLVSKGVISYGTSGYGYDLRLSRDFTRVIGDGVLDPKQRDSWNVETFQSDTVVIEPGETLLARSFEYFRIPRHILALVWGKSTYARCGIIVNVTPLEPEWEGYITMALVNGGRHPVRLYAGEGIAQVVFMRADDLCRTSYADRKGKYQAQKSIELPKVE